MLVDTSALLDALDNYSFLELVKSKEAELLNGSYYVGKDFDYYRFLSSLPEKEFFVSQGTYALTEKDEDVCSIYTYLSDAWICFLLQKNDFDELFDSVNISEIRDSLDVFELDGTKIIGLVGDCPSHLVIPDSVTSIGSYAFAGCSSLTEITIPDSVKSIGRDAFSSCSKLTSVTIGNSVTWIGVRAFEYCSNLTRVTIGNSITSIGDRAFASCTSLTNITFDGTRAKWKSVYRGSSWNKNVPAKVVHCTDGDAVL